MLCSANSGGTVVAVQSRQGNSHSSLSPVMSCHYRVNLTAPFPQSCHAIDFKVHTLEAALPGAWHGRVSTQTGWPTGVWGGRTGWTTGVWGGRTGWTTGVWGGRTGWTTGVWGGRTGWTIGIGWQDRVDYRYEGGLQVCGVAGQGGLQV